MQFTCCRRFGILTLLMRCKYSKETNSMKDCELLTKCLYFNDKLKNMPTASEMVKNMYCRWHYEECARYRVAMVLGTEYVPPDLFPPETERADKLLAQLSHTH